MTHRFFSASDAVYEQVRLSLDAAWGLPNAGQTTAFTPAASAPHMANGLAVLAVDQEFCEYEAVAAMLPQLLASGAVTEIDRAAYFAAMPTGDG